MSLPLEFNGPAFFNDPYPAYAALRAHGAPVFHQKTGAWLIGRFADVESVLRDPRISKKIQRAEATVFETSVLFRDPPDHGRIRGLLNQAFASFEPTQRDALITQAHALIVDDAPWLFVVHDLNPRALSPRVKGFKQAQSWYQDFTQLTVTAS